MNYDDNYDYDSELIFDAAGAGGGSIVPVVVVLIVLRRTNS